MHPHEHVRATLRRGLVGGGRFTVVREPRSALSVALWPYSQVLHAFAISDRVSGPARFPGLARGVQAYRHPQGGYRESVGRGQRFFDDNAWVGLAFLQRHLYSGGSRSRQRAKDIDDFVWSGLDPASGGVLWVEGGDTLNACSTGAGALLHTLVGGISGGPCSSWPNCATPRAWFAITSAPTAASSRVSTPTTRAC